MTHLPCTRHRARQLRRRARGFSMVELLVAMVVGLLLVAGLGSLFANSSQAGNELEKSVRQLESGRYAMEMLGEDLNMAGYYGELRLEGAQLLPVDACATAIADLGWRAPTVLPAAPAQAPVPITLVSPTDAAGLSCLENHKPGTPALVVRRVDTSRVAPGNAIAGAPYLQTSRCVNDPVEPLFWLAAVPSGEAVQGETPDGPTPSADETPGGSGPAPFALRDLDCSAVSAVQRYISRVYYIATCSECALDTVPTLKRAELLTSTMVVSPLAEGVDDMAFDFGFDTDGNGSPDVYRPGLSGAAGAADNDWANVVGVRVHLLTRSTEPSTGFTDTRVYSLGLSGTSGPFNDGFKRRVYTMTNRLHNVAGPREPQPLQPPPEPEQEQLP